MKFKIVAHSRHLRLSHVWQCLIVWACLISLPLERILLETLTVVEINKPQMLKFQMAAQCCHLRLSHRSRIVRNTMPYNFTFTPNSASLVLVEIKKLQTLNGGSRLLPTTVACMTTFVRNNMPYDFVFGQNSLSLL